MPRKKIAVTDIVAEVNELREDNRRQIERLHHLRGERISQLPPYSPVEWEMRKQGRKTLTIADIEHIYGDSFRMPR